MSLQLEYCLNLHAPMIAQVCMASYRGWGCTDRIYADIVSFPDPKHPHVSAFEVWE